MKFKSIVLIDDSETDNFIHKRLIKILDLTEDVRVFNNGLEGINYLKILSEVGIAPDLIFLDLNMPVMNGLRFLQEYKRLPPKFKESTKVIVLTSSSYPADFRVLKALGFQDSISKPLTPENLLRKLQVLFDKDYLITG